MGTRKSILKFAKPTGKQDSYGNFSYNLTFDNGDSGLFSTKTDQLGTVGFIIGNEITYNIEKKLSQSGKEWFKITRYKEPQVLHPNTSFQSNGKSPDVQDMIIRQSSVKAAIDFMVGSGQNLNLDKMLYTAEIIFKFCKTGEVNGQTPAQNKVAHKEPFSVPNENDLPF